MTDESVMSIKHTILEKIYFKEIRLYAGAKVLSHSHKFDHGTLLAQGHVEMEIDGQTKHYFGPCIIPVRKQQQHTITALSDVCMYCIHAIPEGLQDPDEIDKVLIEG